MKPAEGVVTRPSAYGFAETLGRLQSALERRQLEIFARFEIRRIPKHIEFPKARKKMRL